jgi:hypothetical protein
MLPVLVHLATDTPAVKAIAPGFDTWLPYSEALLAIGREYARGFDHPRKAMPFIRQTLDRDLVGNTLLLCHAQNLRRAWPWIGNSKIARDELAFGDEALQHVAHWPGIRVVRVRDSAGYETPEWYADDGSVQGFACGLFRMGDRVFASTHGKPNQFKHLSTSLSKAEAWTSQRGKHFSPAPDAHAWNPSLFELTVACLQPEDQGNAWPWAALTHELRQMAFHYDQATALPLPLHLAQLMEEYVLPLDERDEES